MQNKIEVLKACTVEGTTVKLPPVQLDRKLYQDVAKSLELIGGKWKGGKIGGFVFNECPKELLHQIATGEKRNIKKEYQFFATPAHLANKLVQLADIQTDNLVLEPSAGQGAIVTAILKKHPALSVHGFELMEINRTFLSKINDFILLGDDFLKAENTRHYLYNTFDRVIANPPFSKNQDIDHIIKMFLCCKNGGRIVTIASKHWQYATEKKCQQFREWLKEVNAEIIEIEAGEFKESGTTIPTCIIIIDKNI